MRTLIFALGAMLAALTIAAAVGLALVTHHMGRAAEGYVVALEGVRDVESIRIKLRRHSRETFLDAMTSGADAGARETIEDLTAELHHLLDQTRVHTTGEVEHRLHRRLATQVEAYLAAPRGPAERGPLESYQAQSVRIDRVNVTIEALVAQILARADRARGEVQRWAAASTVAGFALVGLLVLVLGVAAGFGRRWIYQPFFALGDVIARYGRGDTDARAPEDGPAEIAAMARHFNDLADGVAHQRQMQFQLVAAIAHDLRNPITALRTATTARLLEKLDDPERMRKVFEVVQRASGRLERMTDDLLDASRLETGRLELRVDEHDLRDIVREAVNLFRNAAGTRELVSELPPEAVRIRCDGARIAQVLGNLLSNAIKYSPEGGRVRIALTCETTQATIAVTDQGKGIPAHERAQVFEPFRRSHRSDGIPGVGLGLWISQRLAQAHRGWIEIDDVVPVGTVFRLRLPREAPEETVDAALLAR